MSFFNLSEDFIKCGLKSVSSHCICMKQYLPVPSQFPGTYLLNLQSPMLI